MSATYKCDFCNKKATYHIGGYGLNSYSHRTEVSKKLHNKGSCDFYATLKIEPQWCEYKQDNIPSLGLNVFVDYLTSELREKRIRRKWHYIGIYLE